MNVNSVHKASIEISWKTESLFLAKPFKISRGIKTHADVVIVYLCVNGYAGWAEAVPYARYGESIPSTIDLLKTTAAKLSNIKEADTLLAIERADKIITHCLSNNSARNLLDCALWDVKSKVHNTSVSQLLNLPTAQDVISAQTLSVDTIEIMQVHAREMSHLPLLKVKLDAHDVLAKMRAIHKACPNSQFIVDANEAWSFDLLVSIVNELRMLNVVLIEQPLPANDDSQLEGYQSCVALCADESCHTSHNIDELKTKYQMVNIKLDKSGGLTEAVALFHAAKKANMSTMLGCMVASSLAMAPIYTLAKEADYIDLDGPVLVAHDREHGFIFDNARMHIPSPFLWGNL